MRDDGRFRVIEATLLDSGNPDCRLTPDVACPQCTALELLDTIEREMGEYEAELDRKDDLLCAQVEIIERLRAALSRIAEGHQGTWDPEAQVTRYMSHGHTALIARAALELS